MTSLEFLSLLSALIGIVFLIRSIFVREKISRKRIIDLSIFLICSICAVSVYVISNRPAPLICQNKQDFKSAAFSHAAMFRRDPLGQALTRKGDIERVVVNIKKNKSYRKEMPQETAIFYRLHGASILLSAARGPNIAQSIKNAFPYLKDSVAIYPEIWTRTHEKKAYENCKALHKNLPEKLDLASYLYSIFAVAMISSEEAEVQKIVQEVIGIIAPLTGKPKADIDFFLSFSGKGGDYRTCIFALCTLIEGQGGKVKGPLFAPTQEGKTKIQYILIPKNRPQGTVEWVVDKKLNLIEPKTTLAEELDEYVRYGKKN